MRHARHTTYATSRRRGARALLVGALSLSLLTTGTSSLAAIGTENATLGGSSLGNRTGAPAEPAAADDIPVEAPAPADVPATTPPTTAPAAPADPAPAAPASPAPAASVSPAPVSPAPVNPAPAAPTSPAPADPAIPAPAAPQRSTVSPLSVPAASGNSAVINVNVGAMRTSPTAVSPLAGATLELWEGSSAPTAKVKDAWATCVSDADGDCSFTVPDTQPRRVERGRCTSWFIFCLEYQQIVVEAGGANVDRQFWVVQKTDPAGYFRNETLRTSGGSTAYTFQTSATLRPREVHEYPAAGSGSMASGGLWQSSMTNPALPPQCGLDVALVLDLSGSVNDHGLGAMKTASHGFVDALTGTPSSVALFTFATTAPKGSGLASGDSYPDLVPVTTAGSAQAVKSRIDAYTATGGTNWDAGLYQVAAAAPRYDVAIVLTDGDPTYSVAANGVGQDGPGSATYLREIERGIFSANALKGKGTRVIAVGVGSGVSGDAANLRAISGPVQGSDYYQSASYAAAGAALRELALASCRGTVSVVKEVVPEGAPAGSVQGSAPAPGWQFSASSAPHLVTPTAGTTGDDGALSFTVTMPGGTTRAPVTVRETARSGYTLQQVGGKNGVCKNLATGADVPVANDGELGFRVAATATAPIACTVYNRETPPTYADLTPGIDVVKQAWDVTNGPVPEGAAELPHGAELVGGTTITWTYVVSNTGTSQLDDIEVTDTFSTDSGTGEVVLTCPSTSLAAGASMTCTGSGPVGAGTYGLTADRP